MFGTTVQGQDQSQQHSVSNSILTLFTESVAVDSFVFSDGQVCDSGCIQTTDRKEKVNGLKGFEKNEGKTCKLEVVEGPFKNRNEV